MDVGLNNQNILGKVNPAFNNVVFLVEANSEEQFNLWQNWSKESMSNIEPLSDNVMNSFSEEVRNIIKPLNDKVKNFNRERVNWVEVSAGFSTIIGYVDDSPINVSFRFAFINGKKICFYDGVSQLVDYKTINDWLIKQFQLTHDCYTRWNHVNSSNFHNCINSLDNLDKETRNTVYKS